MLYSLPLQIEEFKSNGDDFEVNGYISTFGNVDLGNDVVMPGAFTETLKSGPKVRFLMSHDPRLVLGVPKKLKEDKKGLFGSFKISKTQLGMDTHTLLLDGAIDSFSIGYKSIEWDIIDEDVRRLKQIELYEASLVPIPMNSQAAVTGVKENGSLAEQIQANIESLNQLFEVIRGLVDKNRPLNEGKRKELAELLETFSGLDDVRSNIQSVLTVKSSGLVEVHRVKNQLAELRKRLPEITSKE
jgi:HK97 family phage prohead protease